MYYLVFFFLIVILVIVVAWSFTGKIDPYEAKLVAAPGVVSNGSGYFYMTPTDNPKIFRYTLDYQNLTGPATAAHIHYSSNKDIAYPLAVNPTGHTTGTVTFKDVDLPLATSGQFYVNVHTARYPDGEITGNLVYIP